MDSLDSDRDSDRIGPADSDLAALSRLRPGLDGQLGKEEGRGGGKDTHVNRLGGAGVQHAQQCGRAEFKSLYTSRGKRSKEFPSPSKSSKGFSDGP
jgi:hypothetical protein